MWITPRLFPPAVCLCLFSLTPSLLSVQRIMLCYSQQPRIKTNTRTHCEMCTLWRLHLNNAVNMKQYHLRHKFPPHLPFYPLFNFAWCDLTIFHKLLCCFGILFSSQGRKTGRTKKNNNNGRKSISAPRRTPFHRPLSLAPYMKCNSN